MTLIGVLLALIAERALGHLPGFGEPAPLRFYLRALRTLIPVGPLWRSWAAPLLAAAPAVALVAWLQHWLAAPLPHLALSTAVLFLCLGPRDLADDIARLLAARKAGDTATVTQLSRALMRGAEPESTREDLLGALFIQSHERLFGVLLWFFAGGAAGAAAYRIASRLPRLFHEQQPDTVAEQSAVALHTALGWVPARLTAMLYGMAGSMDDAMREWRRLHAGTAGGDWRSRTWALLAEVSGAALSVEEAHSGPAAPASLDDCLREVQSMQTRALLILLAGFAFFTIGQLV